MAHPPTIKCACGKIIDVHTSQFYDNIICPRCNRTYTESPLNGGPDYPFIGFRCTWCKSVANEVYTLPPSTCCPIDPHLSSKICVNCIKQLKKQLIETLTVLDKITLIHNI